MALFKYEEKKIGASIFDEPAVNEPATEVEDDRSQFSKGVSAGIDQTMGLGGALKAAAGSVIGNDEWVQEGMDYYRQKMQEAEQVGAKTTQVEDIENLGDFFNYAGYTLGTLVPDVVGGGVGGIAAKFAAKKALKSTVEKGADTVSGRLADRALRRNYDALAGAGAYSAAANTAENFADIYEETGLEAPGKALAVGVMQGALDTVGVPFRAANRLFPDKMTDLKEGVAEKLIDERGYLRRVLSEAVKTGGAEGFTEATQEVLGRAAVAWAQESLPEDQQREFLDIMADEQARSMYLNAFAAGGLAGSVGGGAIEGTRFSKEEENTRLRKLIQARRDAVRIADEQREGTETQEYQEPAEREQPQTDSIYLGNMPVELQSQLVEDGVDADTATTEQVMASAAKLPEEQRNRAMAAVQSQTDIQTTRRQRMTSTKVPSADQVQGDAFLVSTPQTIKEKVEEMNARDDGGQTVGGTANLTKIIGKVRKPVKIMGKDGNELELESLKQVAQNKTFDDKPEVEEMVSSVLDVVDRGMPMEHVKLIQGTYLFDDNADIPNDAAAGYLPNSRTIGVKLENLRAGATDEAQARRNRFAIAHEIWHAVDAKNDYSSSIPDFALDVQVDESMNVLLDQDAMDIEAGPALLELMNNWDQGTELGKYFAYPLNTLLDDIKEASPENRGEVVRTAQKEMFAQLGAALIANESLLEQQAPTAYNLIKELRDNPNIAAGEITRANVQAEVSPTIADTTEVRGDVRTPPIEGSPEVQDTDGAGPDSGVSVEAEQASPELAPAPEPEAGDTAGQLLRAEQYIAGNPNARTSDVQRDLRLGYNKTRELIDELLSQGRIEEDPANLTYTATQQEAAAVQEPASEVTVESRTRGENFATDGQYEYTLSDGSVYKMGRDPVARQWNLDPQYFSTLGYGTLSPQAISGMGSNEKEAIAQLLKDHADRPEKPDFMVVSSRYPTGAKRQIDPEAQVYQSDLESYNAGTTSESNAELIRQYNNLTKTEKRRGTKGINEALVNHVKDNLLFIFDRVPEDTRDQSKLWYVGANRVAQKFSDKYDITLAQASAVIANLSPQKDWYMNASLAERVIDIYSRHKSDPWTGEMADTAARILKPLEVEAIAGKSLQELLDTAESEKAPAAWIRVWDQTYNEPHYRLVSPDGKFLEFQTNKDGVTKSKAGWGSLGEIGKTVLNLMNPDQTALSQSLGEQNKVRNFYNNIFDPMSDKGFVTIDTHAVAAGLLKPLAGGSTEVTHNFGGVGTANSRITGHKGTYSLYEEAYKLAAKERGVLPREMQSITWEAVRGLFSPAYKSNKQNQLFVNGIWDQYSRGKITLDAARERIIEHAGGIDEPVWKRSDGRDFEEAGETSYVAKLPGAGVPGQRLQEESSDGGRDRDDAGVSVEEGGEVESPDFIRTPREDVSFNLNDEFIVEKNLEQRLKSVIPDTTRQKLIDRLEALGRTEDRIAASLGLERLPSALSARDAENLMHSKVQKDLEDFEEKYVQTIAEEVKAGEFDLDQVGLYLLAKHAPERNAVIAEKERALREEQKQSLRERIEKNTEKGIGSEKFQEQLAILEEAPLKFQETGSGMTDAEAAQVLAKAEEEGATGDLEKIADKVYSMLSDMRENMVEAGLLDDDTRADWEDRYQFYVPLKGFAAYPEGLEMKGGTGAQGFNIRGSESFRAKGRTTLPVNPLLVAFKDAEEKIVRAEKNRVAQRLLKLFEKIQSPSDWEVFTPAFRPAKSDNPSVMKSDAEMKNEVRFDDGMPRYIQVKRLGQTFYIEVKDKELNRQLQTSGVGMFNNSVDFMNNVLTNMQKLQNFRRNMIINYNPSWGLVNPLRDIQTGLAFALSETDSKGGRLQDFEPGELVANVSRGYLNSMTAFWRMRRGTEGKSDVQKEYDQYAKEYVEDGAPTGLSVTKSLEEQQARFKSIIEQGDTRKFLRKAADVVEDYNQTMENAVRLSAYVEARKGGVDREDAATLAKDLTVNFNRKGEYSSAVDSLYLFFNAAIQGNVNIMKAMLRPAADGSKFTRARVLASSMVAFGFARTLMNIDMAGEDDDGESKYLDFNEYALKTGMVVMLGEQGVSIPMPYGYGLFDNIGRYAAEYAAGVKSEGEVAKDLMLSVDHHFNPQGLHAVENRDLVETAVLRTLFFLGPDTLDLAVEQAANINYFGTNITIPSNPFLVKRPAAQATKRGTNDVLEGFTEFVNNATGGSEYRSGAIDMSPERIQHIGDFFLGGVGRFFSDLTDTVAKLESEEDDLRSTDVPILRTFAPIAAEYSDRVDFYENRSNYRQYQTEYKEASPQEKAALRQRFGADLYQFDVRHKAIEKRLRALSTRKRQLNENESIDLYRRIELLQQIAEEEERMYDEYNKRWNAVKP